jgi:FkbM family methyltransferase
MKKIIKKIFHYIPIDITKNQKYDSQTKKAIAKVCRNNSNCIDVGCHTGEILDLMIKYAPNGRHYGFEPIPELYKQLQIKYADTLCTISNVALSNSDGSTTFNYVISNPAYSGIKKRAYDRAHEQDTTIEVQSKMLDHMLLPGHKVDLIKIDVEGAEMLVLEGARETIARNKPVIIFEHGLGASDVYGTTPAQVFGFFKDLNYHIATLENWLKAGAPFTEPEFEDQYFGRKNHYFIAYPKK